MSKEEKMQYSQLIINASQVPRKKIAAFTSHNACKNLFMNTASNFIINIRAIIANVF